MNDEDGWVWTTEAADGLRLMPGDLRNVADALGIELRPMADARRRAIHRDDVALLAEVMASARRNREGRTA